MKGNGDKKIGLTGKQKCFAILRLGSYETLGQVQQGLMDEFGLNISTQGPVMIFIAEYKIPFKGRLRAA